MVHLVLEENLSKEKEIDLDELNKAFLESRSKFDPEKKINDELISVGQQIINEFYDRHSGEKFRIEHKEKEFKNELKYFNVRYIPYLIFKNATENTTSSVVY